MKLVRFKYKAPVTFSYSSKCHKNVLWKLSIDLPKNTLCCVYISHYKFRKRHFSKDKQNIQKPGRMTTGNKRQLGFKKKKAFQSKEIVKM